jgi:hypothetical protein
MLEQEAHKFGLPDIEFPPAAIGSPQQMQILGLIRRKAKPARLGS